MKIDHQNIEGLDYEFSVEVNEQDAILVNQFKYNRQNCGGYKYAHFKILPDVISIVNDWSTETRWN